MPERDECSSSLYDCFLLTCLWILRLSLMLRFTTIFGKKYLHLKLVSNQIDTNHSQLLLFFGIQNVFDWFIRMRILLNSSIIRFSLSRSLAHCLSLYHWLPVYRFPCIVVCLPTKQPTKIYCILIHSFTSIRIRLFGDSLRNQKPYAKPVKVRDGSREKEMRHWIRVKGKIILCER